jgi:hypothetical protein
MHACVYVCVYVCVIDKIKFVLHTCTLYRDVYYVVIAHRSKYLINARLPVTS